MMQILNDSTFLGVAISLFVYEIASQIKKKWNLAVLNPLLVTIVLIIVFLGVTGLDYDVYNEGAQYISYLLTPATVCLAVPLYEKFRLLLKYPQAILMGIISGVMTSMITILVFCLIFQMGHGEYVTLLPKSITTAIGMAVSEQFGGVVTITVAVIIVTGIFGNVIAQKVFDIFQIKHPIARGIALGTASHVIGTSKAMEFGQVEGAMSSLSVAVAGILTVLTTTIFANFI